MPYLQLMPKPFSHIVQELKEAVGSYDRLELYFDGNPVKSMWSKWGRGNGGPGDRNTKHICKVLSCSIAQLRGEQDWEPSFLDRLREKAEAKIGKAPRNPGTRQFERDQELVEGMLASIEQLASGMRSLLQSLKERQPTG